MTWNTAGHLLILLLLIAVLAVASISDIQSRRIPNWTILATLILFGAWCLVGPINPIVPSLEAGLITFVISFPLYLFKVMGAGDSKLASAVALFVGLTWLGQYALSMTLFGGAIVLIGMVIHPTRALVMLQLKGKGDFGRGVPYGVAISAAGLLSVYLQVRGVAPVALLAPVR